MYYDIHTHTTKPQEQSRSCINVACENYGCASIPDAFKFSIGLHPWHIQLDQLAANLALIRENVNLPDCIAVGECGLDKKCSTSFEWQEKAFVEQIKISEEIKKPLIIHCVKATDEVLYYKKTTKPTQAWIIHGFRGKPEQMESFVKKGIYLSFGAEYNKTTLLQTDPNFFFLETDNSSLSIQDVYQQVAFDLKTPERELIKCIEENISKVFYSLKK